MISEILLRRKHKLTIEQDGGNTYGMGNLEPARYIVAIAKNIESLGFAFDKGILEALKTYNVSQLTRFYNELLPMLKKLCAADVEYRPMYPNFPAQVASASDAELFVNAILHYITFGALMPEYEKNERMPLIDSDKMIVLSVGDADDIYDVFTNLVSSKTSLSEQDKADVKTIMKTYADYEAHLPDEIPLKENVAMVANYILSINPYADETSIAKYFKTATDVLRYITSISGGDISLAERTKYTHLRRPERRMIMNLLAGCRNLTEDMFRYRDEWIRIGEIVHPWEYKDKKYGQVKQVFNVLRNEKKPLMTMGIVEEAIKRGDMVTAATKLTERPGEFARRLDKLLRGAKKDQVNYIVGCFEDVASKVSTPVLYQVRQVFLNRCKSAQPIRVFMPKGSVAKAISISNELPELDEALCRKVVRVCENAIVAAYKQRETMGCVYIDPELKNYNIPFSQRSASGGNKIIVRGSRVSIDKDAKTIRGFIWWTNTNNSKDRWSTGRVDLDLSACILDENFKYKSHVSYTHLRDNALGAYHSGDITDGGSVKGAGVAEFLDVDIDSVVKNGGRYICYQVYSYTQQKFCDLPNCRFGWMEREYPDSGEIFEPKTVDMAIDLNAQSTVYVPVLFDCVERQIIWMDMTVRMESFYGGNNIESNLSGVSAVAYAIANIDKANLYDLVYLNALGRGLIVNDRNMADIIFSNDTTKPTEPVYENDYDTEGDIIGQQTKDIPVVTAFDVDYYMGKLL